MVFLNWAVNLYIETAFNIIIGLGAFFVFAIIFSESLIRKILAFIGIFFLLALLFLCLHSEFLALVLIILYVGAIAVLFLFLVMLVNIMQKVLTFKKVSKRLFFFKVGVVCFIFWLGFVLNPFMLFFDEVNFLFSDESYLVLPMEPKLLVSSTVSEFLGLSIILAYDVAWSIFYGVAELPFMFNMSDIEHLGFFLWKIYGVYILLSGILLLVSIIGSISILKNSVLYNVEKRQILKSTSI